MLLKIVYLDQVDLHIFESYLFMFIIIILKLLNKVNHELLHLKRTFLKKICSSYEPIKLNFKLITNICDLGFFMVYFRFSIKLIK